MKINYVCPDVNFRKFHFLHFYSKEVHKISLQEKNSATIAAYLYKLCLIKQLWMGAIYQNRNVNLWDILGKRSHER